MRFNFVQKRLSQFFQQYIALVIRFPWLFILPPVFLTASLSMGLRYQQQALVKDDVDQYVPINAQARKELQQLDQLFHIDDFDPFYATRRYDIKRSGYIIVTSIVDGDDVLRPAILEAALGLWNLIQRLTVEGRNDTTFNYPSICVKFPISPELDAIITRILSHNSSRLHEKCVSNPLLATFKLLLNGDFNLKNGTIDQTILKLIMNTFSSDFFNSISNLLGGITYDEKRRISGAKAIMLPYALRHSTAFQDSLAEKWELKLADFILRYTSNIIRTSLWTYETLAAESEHDREKLIRMLLPCFAVLLLYTIACCCLPSWIYSRPWLAAGGVISAAAAVISSIGLLLLLGCRITSIAYSVPFVVFSVGVDNVFITLSAWRSTSVRAPFQLRMREAFSDAAVSITITSLTDLISFTVGCFTTFPSVQLFCLYTVSSIFFTYLYHLTFFSGILVLTNKREVAGRHCLTFQKTSKKIHPTKAYSMPYINPEVLPYKIHSLYLPAVEEKETISHCNHFLAHFFRTTYSNFLLKPLVRFVVLIIFALYIALSIWGCMHMKIGLEPNDLLPSESYGRQALAIAEKYFSDYGSYLHVWMYNLSKFDFSNRKIWIVLQNEIALYEYTEYTGPSDSWLRALVQYSQKNDIEITSNNFIYILKNIFLPQPQFARFKRDVLFDSTGNLLDVSRVLVQLRYVGTSNQSHAMKIFRSIAKSSIFETGVYAAFFQFAEQYSAMLPSTLTTIAIASIAVTVVSLLLIPETVASVWVSLSIISVNVGVLGFMTFWDVRLDFVSMITIIMSIGFCVDFASHMAFNFAKITRSSSSERMRNALYSVGVPVLQSASSTIIGVSFLATADSYVFCSFLKTIILVIIFGVLHGLLILPILLTLCTYKKAMSHEPDEASKNRKVKSAQRCPERTICQSVVFHADAHQEICKCPKCQEIYTGIKKSVAIPLLDGLAQNTSYWNNIYHQNKINEVNYTWNAWKEANLRQKSCPNIYNSFTIPKC